MYCIIHFYELDVTNQNNSNNNYRVLMIKIRNVSAVTLRVAYSPVLGAVMFMYTCTFCYTVNQLNICYIVNGVLLHFVKPVNVFIFS